MGEPQPGAQVARDMGLALAQIYSLVKSGKVTNHKKDGYPIGKGLLVDPDEVTEARAGSRRKGTGPGKSQGKATPTRKELREGAADTIGGRRGPKLKDGDIVSYHRGATPSAGAVPAKSKGHEIGVVLGHNRYHTYLEGDRYHVFTTQKLNELMGLGIAHVERPVPLLGMIMLQWIRDEKVELAESLETWMEANGLEVVIPETIVAEEESDSVAEPEPAEQLAGDDDD